MSRTTIRTVAALGVSGIAVAAVGWAAFRSLPAPVVKPSVAIEDATDQKPIPVRPDTEPYEPYKFLYTTEQSIQVYKERIKRDPQDHISHTTLGSLHLRRAKETGSFASYDEADSMFAAALKLFPKHDPARLGRAAVANARHQFADARKLADEIYKADPADSLAVDALVIRGDAELELGRYDDADKTLQEIVKKSGQPTPAAVLARLARMAELRGEVDAALDLLKRAAAMERTELASQADLAWYKFRMCEIHLSQGKLANAERLLEEALGENPSSADLKVGLAKLRLAQGRAADAVTILDSLLKADRELEAFLEKVRTANGTPTDPSRTLEATLTSHENIDTLLLLGDAHVAAGSREEAEKQFRAAEKKVNQNLPVAVREFILHCCDANIRLPQVLTLAEREAKARQDVYSCDSLAWALYKNDKLDAAEKAAADAMRLGTRDALILYHAGIIAHARGQKVRANELLAKALSVNPHFHAKHAAEAKRLLAK